MAMELEPQQMTLEPNETGTEAESGIEPKKSPETEE